MKERLLHALLGGIGIAFSLVLFGACASDWERKLSKKELQTLLEELYTAEELVVSSPIPLNDTMHLALQKQLFAKYGITPSDYDSIIYYYNRYEPLLFSSIVRKAAHNVQTRFLSLQKENDFIDQNRLQLETTYCSASELNSLFVEDKGFYPVSLNGQGEALLRSVMITDNILKGGVLSLSLSVSGIPSIVQHNPQLAPSLELSYYVADSLYISTKCTLKKDGKQQLKLSFDEKFPSGRLTLVAYRDAHRPSLMQQFLLSDISWDFVPGMSEEEEALKQNELRIEEFIRETVPLNSVK